MYLSHFGLNEPPFRITPHVDFFFAGANRGATLEALLYAITHDEGIVKVSGEVGSGKTMLCRVLMERLPEHVDTILLSNPSLSREEILHAIADELKLDLGAERQTVLLRALQEHLIALYGQNRRVVVLIDEAHAMPQETLEQIRLLSNLETGRSKLLQIVLFGQPELDLHLGTPHMRQLKERITHSFRLEPMLRSDIEEYIEFRMRAAGYRGPNVFTPAAVRQIVKASEGLTRRINILADKSLLAAFADNTHAITAKHAVRAIRDSEFFNPGPSKAKIALASGGLAAGLALGLGAHFLLAQAPPATQTIRSASIAAPVQPAPAPAAAGNASQAAPAPTESVQVTSAPAQAPVPPSQTTTGAAVAPAGVAPVAGRASPAATPPATTVPSGATQVQTAAPTRQASPPAAAAPAVTAVPPQAQSAPAPPQAAVAAKSAATPAPEARAAPANAAVLAQSAAAQTPAPASPAQTAAPASTTGQAQPATAAAAEQGPMQASANAKPGSKNYVPPAPPSGRLTRERFAATQAWLKTAPADHYSLQLLTADTREVRRIEELLARAPGRQLEPAEFHVYAVRINDRQHYRVAYGLYASLADVSRAIKALPQAYKQLGPYHRTVERMRSQNRQ